MSGVYTKKIILLASDVAVVRPLLERFAHIGYEARLVADIPTFISESARLRPDMAIVDIGSPGLDGFAAIEALRAHADLAVAQIPVIIISAVGDLVEISRGLRLGIRDYIVKSTFDATTAVDKIRMHLGDTTAPQAVPVSGAELSTTKLLIVEDDKFLRDLAAQKLSKEHLQVSTAVDGEQGIAIAEKEIPNIILLDILLPGIDGFEVLRRIRANPVLEATHVAMLSNFGQREDIERALKGGADEFLIKANYTLDEVVEEVKKIISKPRVSKAS